jgi:hypothetical protein
MALAIAIFVLGFIIIVITSVMFHSQNNKLDINKSYGQLKASYLAQSAIDIEFLRFLTFFDQLSHFKREEFNMYYKRDILRSNVDFLKLLKDGRMKIDDFKVLSFTNGSGVIKIVGKGKYKRYIKRVKQVMKVGM